MYHKLNAKCSLMLLWPWELKCNLRTNGVNTSQSRKLAKRNSLMLPVEIIYHQMCLKYAMYGHCEPYTIYGIYSLYLLNKWDTAVFHTTRTTSLLLWYVNFNVSKYLLSLTEHQKRKTFQKATSPMSDLHFWHLTSCVSLIHSQWRLQFNMH